MTKNTGKPQRSADGKAARTRSGDQQVTYRPSALQRFLPFVAAAVVPFILGATTDGLGFWWKALITVAILAVVARLAWMWTPRGELTHREDIRLWRTPSDRSWAAVTIFGLLALPFVLASDFTPPMGFPWATWFVVVNTVLIFAMGAAAFNLLVGYSGQISLAHVAFLALGSIMAGIVGVQWSGGNFWLALPAAAVAGAVVGAVSGLPALRLKHLYLLLATFGFHFVMMLVWREYLQEYFGFVGIRFKGEHAPRIASWLHWLPNIDPDENGEFIITGQFRWYWVIMPITVVSLLFMVNVIRTREGRAFAAVRDRDVSASLLGINVARSKLMAFALSSAVVAMSGVLASFYTGSRGEDSFNVQKVLDYAVIIVVGGFSSIQGAIFGSAFFWFLPEWFKWAREELWFVRDIDYLSDHASEIDLAIKGLLVVIILVFKPTGLAGMWRDFKTWVGRSLSRSNP
ncbi:branched-chain amino acid ABC transporter permease [Candidatus Poriferisocius sp.]|uniref:branched-chain amino acid ABC transporter permease n=1 Tax=Candidatus Poriferisocius sp. TaxID=3101276 RepID=UPI003B01A4D2